MSNIMTSPLDDVVSDEDDMIFCSLGGCIWKEERMGGLQPFCCILPCCNHQMLLNPAHSSFKTVWFNESVL